MDGDFGVIAASGKVNPDGSLHARMTSDGFRMEFVISGDLGSLASLRICSQQMPQLLTGIMQGIIDEGEADPKAIEAMHARLVEVSEAESGPMSEERFTEMLGEAVDGFLEELTKEENE